LFAHRRSSPPVEPGEKEDGVKLTRDVALVGGGNFGFNLSAPLDCHVYLLDGGDELALVDAGLGGPHGGTEEILANVKADGYDLQRITKLLLTHYHADHAGGAADFRERLGLEVHGSSLCARTMQTGDEETISLPFAKAAGFYPADYVFCACPCEPSLTEGVIFNVGKLKVTVFDTPGHCRGHVSLLVEGGERRYLLSGDLVFFGGTVVIQNIPDCSIQEYGESCRKMAGVDFEALLPGHLAISLRDGKRHIDAAAKQFGSLMVPKNAV
jgi:glyoxylase-like metal-dependent hydrolase (beta-lactamase superfamily II)